MEEKSDDVASWNGGSHNLSTSDAHRPEMNEFAEKIKSTLGLNDSQLKKLKNLLKDIKQIHGLGRGINDLQLVDRTKE